MKLSTQRKVKEYYPGQFTPTDMQFCKKGESGFAYWCAMLVKGVIIVAENYKREGYNFDEDD